MQTIYEKVGVTSGVSELAGFLSFWGFQVRHPPQSGWLDELGRLKGGRPLYPTPGSNEILRPLDKTK
jgi:hypothetical protein